MNNTLVLFHYICQLAHNGSFVNSVRNALFLLVHPSTDLSSPLKSHSNTHTNTHMHIDEPHNTPFLPQAAEAITALCAFCLEEAAINRSLLPSFSLSHSLFHSLLLFLHTHIKRRSLRDAHAKLGCN